MHHWRRRVFWVATLACAAILLPTALFAQDNLEVGGDRASRGPRDAGEVDVLIATAKPYDNVIQAVRTVNGTVRYEYKSIDAIAATIPVKQLDILKGMPEVFAVEKDHTFTLGGLRDDLEAAGAEYTHTIDGAELTGDAASFTEVAPDGYFPIEVDAMRASDFWNATGHFGEGVIIGIMDTGTADVPAIAGRVIGGESFLSAFPPIDDGLPANSPLNNPHGTWVATTAGANVVFGFLSTSGLVQALNAYIPGAVIPNFFGPGIDGVPMVGPAPFAEFFALKIFNQGGSTTNSVILAAFDRAIELKQLYDAGDPSGVNLRVLNGSFSGGTLYCAEDPFFAAMVAQVNAAGIVTTFSASNEGPGAMTGRDPGTARNTLTVGSTSIAEYEQVLRELQNGPGFGALWRANNAHQVSEFSSRGPTADGRWDPDIVAPGDNIFAQAASGGLNLVSGTSFSAPNLAGCAALLLSNNPAMTPDQVRGKLLNGANPNVLQDNPTREDQGFGFVDMMGALAASDANPPDVGAEHEDVAANVASLGFAISDGDHFTHTTDWLVPGEGHEIFVPIAQPHTSLDVAISVEQENTPPNQNLLFGDRALFSMTNSWTHWGAYYAIGLVSTGAAVSIPEAGLDFGLVRINVAGDDDNVGRVRAAVTVDKGKGSPVASKHKIAHGKVAQSETDVHAFDVPAGLDDLAIYLGWGNGWDKWPTNDLDVILVDPDGFFNFAGATLSAPERVFISNPKPGTWTAYVQGFTVWPNEDGDVTEPYQLRSDVDVSSKAVAQPIAERTDALPKRFAVGQNFPNPFNPTTTISYALPEAADVQVEIFDVRGTRIVELVNQHQKPGFHRVTWHGTTETGAAAPSGVYFYTVRAGENAVQKRMLLLK